MVLFIPNGHGSYRMERSGAPIVAVHQVLSTNPVRAVREVVRTLRPGSVFVAQQAPAPNTYLHRSDSLDETALFPYGSVLREEFSGDRLSLVIRTILSGGSRIEPIEVDLPALYCVHSGVIDEVHIETSPGRHGLYERAMRSLESVIFHERAPRYPALIHLTDRTHTGRGPHAENRERL